MRYFKKIATGIVAIVINASLNLSYADVGHSYQIMDVAKAALNAHQNAPSVSSDPLLEAGQYYVRLPIDGGEGADKNKVDFILDAEEIFLTRRNNQKNAVESLGNDIQAAIESGNKPDIKQAYEDYYRSYREGNSSEKEAIEDKQSYIAKLNTRAFYDGNIEKSIQYVQSTDNFLRAYEDKIAIERERIYGEGHASRIAELNNRGNRIEPVFELAGDFSDECNACALDVPNNELDVTPPVSPPTRTPIVRPPQECGGWEYSLSMGMWILYQCP